MYRRFSDACREMARKANQEAMRAGCDYISSGHALVALVDMDSDPMAELLRSFGVEPERTRATVNRLLETEVHDLPESPHLKEVMGYMLETAKRFDPDFIGTEYLLLGLLQDADSVPVRALVEMGVDVDSLRAEVSKRMPPASPQ